MKNSPNPGKEIDTKIQERFQIRWIQRPSDQDILLLKSRKLKTRRKCWKEQEKNNLKYKETMRLWVYFSAEICRPEENDMIYSNFWEEKGKTTSQEYTAW